MTNLRCSAGRQRFAGEPGETLEWLEALRAAFADLQHMCRAPNADVAAIEKFARDIAEWQRWVDGRCRRHRRDGHRALAALAAEESRARRPAHRPAGTAMRARTSHARRPGHRRTTSTRAGPDSDPPPPRFVAAHGREAA
jgi:hypothetical protein